MTTWQECFDKKMTAAHAGKAMGQTRFKAYDWARANGLKWAVNPIQLRRTAMKVTKPQVKTLSISLQSFHAPEGICEKPEHQQTGGKFLMVNHKTGQKIRKASERACYLQAQLMGWVDWDVEELA